MSQQKYLIRELSRDYILSASDFINEKSSFSGQKKYEKLENGNLLFKNVLLQCADKENGNSRIYPYAILKREIDKYQEKIKIKQAVGELNHPEVAGINPANVSHHIDNIWWEGKQVRGDVRILSTTTQGREAMGLIESDITLGISSRSVGSISKKSDHVVVNDDLEVICWDLVIDPSTQNAYLNESKLIVLENKFEVQGELYEKFRKLLEIRG